jgi:hypothetical protein
MVCYGLGVNFQVVNVHCLKLRPLTYIMVICVHFKETKIDMGEKYKWNYIVFFYSWTLLQHHALMHGPIHFGKVNI